MEHSQDLKNWESFKGLCALSFPSIISSMIEPLSSVIDTALVGKYDTKMLASLAIGVSIISSLTWIFNFLIHAPIQKVSGFLKNKETNKIAQTIKLSYFLTLGIAALLLLFILPFRGAIYTFMNVESDFFKSVDDYFYIRVIGHIFVLLFTLNLSILRGYAKVQMALLFVAIACGINILLSYLSLYQWNLGLYGVGLGTVISNAVGFILSLFAIHHTDSQIFKFLKSPIESEIKKSVISACLNIFGRSFFLTLSFFLTTKVASKIGIVALASHQILLQVWLFSSFFTDGVATSGNIIAARLNDPQYFSRLKNILMKLNILGLLIGVSFFIIFSIFRAAILYQFTTDHEVVNMISSLWGLIAIAQIPLSVAYVTDGHMFGLNLFDKLKNYMILAFIFVFSPIIYLAYSKNELLYVWLALFGVGLFRLLTNLFSINRYLKKDF